MWGRIVHGKLQVVVKLATHVQCFGTEAVVPSAVLSTSQIDVAELFCGTATKQVVLELRQAMPLSAKLRL